MGFDTCPWPRRAKFLDKSLDFRPERIDLSVYFLDGHCCYEECVSCKDNGVGGHRIINRLPEMPRRCLGS